MSLDIIWLDADGKAKKDKAMVEKAKKMMKDVEDNGLSDI